MAIFDKFDLAKYVSSKYKKLNDVDISPIKLQKVMYFLFAYYGGWAKYNNENSNFNETDNENISTHLFDANFVAWDYGPVEEEVYQKYKLERKYFYIENADVCKEKLNSIDRNVTGMIEHLYNQIIDLNDFTLVDVSHKDEAWKRNYQSRKNGLVNAKTIDNEDIINEYAKRQEKIQQDKAKN